MKALFEIVKGWKIKAILAGIGVFLFGWIKLLKAENKNLEEENKVLEKKINIKEEQAEAQEAHQQEEQEAIDKIDDSGWRDNI